MGKKRDPRVLDREKSYIERERKFVPVVPENVIARGSAAVAAYKSRKLLLVADHVRLSTDIFVTPDHPDLAPVLPVALRALKFAPQAEHTKPRERIYYADAALKVRDLGVEFRQEAIRQGVRQTIKIARAIDGKDQDDTTLNRLEMHAKLSGPGVALAGAADEKSRRWLGRHFKEAVLIPAFRMVSQRIRMPYYPEGNTDVMIELACDYILFGETMFGKCWQDPKLELEIIKGPADEAACRRILEREERRIMEEFDFVAQRESNAAIGYAALVPDLADRAGRKRFVAMPPRGIWWDRAGRTALGLD